MTPAELTARRSPNPGSPEDIDAGCTCPILDNGHGRGYLGGVKDRETGETLFVYNCDCPVHRAALTTGENDD